MQFPSHARIAARGVVVVALAALAVGVHAQSQPQRLVGEVVSAVAGTLEVRVGAENMKLRLPDDVRITARSKADWSAVTAGTYLGTTAVPQADGTLLAKEVHLFSEAQRGVGEGHHPMRSPGDTMTNATVAAVNAPRPRDTTTNATVSGNAAAAGGHRLTLTYKGGEKTVVVPDDVPIVRSAPGDRSLLIPGAHVVASTRRGNDGMLVAERISVGTNGFATPI